MLKQNIFQNLITSSNDLIKPLTSTDLIQNYRLDLDDKDINEILTNVNMMIKGENIVRNQKRKLKKLTECFIELAETDVQKDAIEQIMKTGEYNGFQLNSMLSTRNEDKKVEIRRRIDFVEMILHDEKLFFYLVNNGINVFHGTNIAALQTILSKGIMPSYELNQNEIQLKTGEEIAKYNRFLLQEEKRCFVSLTDVLDIATFYSKISYNINQTGGKNIPLVICFNGNEIKQKYFKSIMFCSSDFAEIPITSSINPSNIKCIITPYNKIEYVKSIVSKYGVDVLGYDSNDNFKKTFIGETKEGKFYDHTMEVDEQEFERTKERLKARKNNQNNLNASHKNNANQSSEHLSVEQSMTIASDVKMDIVFYLTKQYNSGIPFKPLTANNLITKYNMNEAVAQQLALEVNTMLENYIREKEYKMKNYTPLVLDNFEEETNSIGSKRK